MAPERAQAGARGIEQHRVTRSRRTAGRARSRRGPAPRRGLEPEPPRLGADLLQLRRVRSTASTGCVSARWQALPPGAAQASSTRRAVRNGGVDAHQLRRLVLHLEQPLGVAHQLLHRSRRGEPQAHRRACGGAGLRAPPRRRAPPARPGSRAASWCAPSPAATRCWPPASPLLRRGRTGGASAPPASGVALADRQVLGQLRLVAAAGWSPAPATLRSTALTKPAARDSPSCFSPSTVSETAARRGTREKKIW